MSQEITRVIVQENSELSNTHSLAPNGSNVFELFPESYTDISRKFNRGINDKLPTAS
jgi:hypothetical protein